MPRISAPLGDSPHHCTAKIHDPFDGFSDLIVWSGRAGRNPDRAHSVWKPSLFNDFLLCPGGFMPDFGAAQNGCGVLDVVGAGESRGNFRKIISIAAVVPANDDHQVEIRALKL